MGSASVLRPPLCLDLRVTSSVTPRSSARSRLAAPRHSYTACRAGRDGSLTVRVAPCSSFGDLYPEPYFRSRRHHDASRARSVSGGASDSLVGPHAAVSRATMSPQRSARPGRAGRGRFAAIYDWPASILRAMSLRFGALPFPRGRHESWLAAKSSQRYQCSQPYGAVAEDTIESKPLGRLELWARMARDRNTVSCQGVRAVYSKTR